MVDVRHISYGVERVLHEVNLMRDRPLKSGAPLDLGAMEVYLHLLLEATFDIAYICSAISYSDGSSGDLDLDCKSWAGITLWVLQNWQWAWFCDYVQVVTR